MKWFAERVIKKYPKNSTVKVYYNPEKPDNCCLYPSDFFTIMIESSLLISILIGFTVILFAASFSGIVFGNFFIQIICSLIMPAFLAFLVWNVAKLHFGK